MEDGSNEWDRRCYMGSLPPVNIQASNGAVVNLTLVVKLAAGAGDSLRRWADAIILQEDHGVQMDSEFVCERRVTG